MSAVITVDKLAKEYRTGLRRKRIQALREVSFDVKPGEVFGFVGPNGAGKTTTIRALMGLVRPSAGRCTIFGLEVPSRAARARLGFLPEAPYFYEYLTGRELLDLAGRLHGLDAATRSRRAGEMLERIGLAEAADRALRKYSKGMLQRAGLAQALVHDPELVVLDEPMSGLDPIGRKEVRDLILSLRDAGKTVFFSTHILPDVEAICDRVAIIAKGEVHDVGTVSKILDAHVLGMDVTLRCESAQRATLEARVPARAQARWIEGGEVVVRFPNDVPVEPFLAEACALARVVEVAPHRETLEDLFVRKTKGGPS